MTPPTLLVVGARGLGRQLALHFAGAGYNVVIAARSLDTVERACAEARALGAQALAVQADLEQPQTLRALCDAAWARFGRVDLAVCAQTSGLPFAPRPLTALPEGHLARALAAVPVGTHNLLSALLPRLAAQGAGTFVQIGTGAGQRLRPGFGLQAVAQAALRALLLVAAQEHKAAGVHVAYLAVEGQLESEQARAWIERNGLGKTIPPLAVAQAIAYLHAQEPRAFTHELSVRPAAAE